MEFSALENRIPGFSIQVMDDFHLTLNLKGVCKGRPFLIILSTEGNGGVCGFSAWHAVKTLVVESYDS